MSPEGYSDVFYKGPAYALVIGISKYKYGREPGQELAPNQFTNLKFAAQDAEDFAEFLKNYGFISYNVRQLLDAAADRASIVNEFDNLRKDCMKSGPEEPNPLVIVYFSGHGMADAEDRHYLIPWNAERDRLYATALTNKAFSDCLKDLNTSRLVVFLDACHAGAMGMEAVKDGTLPQYEIPKDLGEGAGRYIIASCKRGERSWEGDKNGIFTGHLLELLKAETDDIKDEEIDIFNLYPVLKSKVLQTAREMHRQTQEPIISDMREATGIVLAINQRARQKRIQEDEQAHEKKRKFLEAIHVQFKKSDHILKTSIVVQLRAYVDKGQKYDEYGEFYAVFEEQLKLWQRDSNSRVAFSCDLLKEAYDQVQVSLKQSQESYLQVKPVDEFVPREAKKVLGSEKSIMPITSRTSTLPSDQQHPRRQLSREARDEILKEMMSQVAYFTETRTLRQFLDEPVSEADFVQKVFEIGDMRKNDGEFQAILERTAGHFRKIWNDPKTVEPTKLLDFRAGKK